MKIIEILFPVFALVVVGYLYGRRYRPNLQAVNQLMLFVFVPALVFDVMSRRNFQVVEYQWLALAGVIVVLGSGIIAWPAGRALGYPQRAFLPTMMFNNCGNLGLPLALLAFGDKGLEGAVILFLVSNLLHFTLGTWIFGGIISWKGLVLNPVNIATVAGLGVNFLQIRLPDFILLPISMLGQIVIPFMLISLGVRMLSVKRADLGRGIVGSVVRPLSGFVPAMAAVWLLPLDVAQVSLLILFATLPPAVLNFLFAEQYQQDPELVASLVLVGNAMAVVTTALVLWWLV
ncbi:MAG: AEC family transporter [Gammaproteobacteria bacterium]|nr:AEC family transporter [Gammaproteobacteria bacterium]